MTNHAETHYKKWGYELWIVNNDEYCGKILYIYPEKKCSVHYHKLKKETFYIMDGQLSVEYSNSLDINNWQNMIGILTTTLLPGQSITIDRNIAHRFYTKNNLPCTFLEISTHHDEQDSYRLIESI